MIPKDFIGTATPLAPADIAQAAGALGVVPAVIDAVCDVESAGSGFLPDKRPKILFEAHVFGKLTAGRYTRSHPNVSAPNWNRALYGAAGAHQYQRLAEAVGLNQDAALKSASWGRFQIMGQNYQRCGFADVESFVGAMCESEANHLAAFVAFCKAGNLVRYLVSHNWERFAASYNGPGQVESYSAALGSAYHRHDAKTKTA